MSRIGKLPVKFDSKVQVNVTPNNEVVVKGQKGVMTIKMRKEISAKIEASELNLVCNDGEDQTRAYQGMYRSLINNAVIGLTTGYAKKLEISGVGYRAAISGKQLELTVGYSHPVKLEIPVGLEVKVDKQTNILIDGFNKELVGQFAAKVRSWKEPEPYLGKGIKYSDEVIRRKAGKTAAK